MKSKLSCKEKAIYVSQSEANASILLAEKKHGVKLKSYKCLQCELWHLASKLN